MERTNRGRPGFLHLPSAVLALVFLARRTQPSLSLVDREVEFFVYPRNNRFPLVGHNVKKILSSRDCAEIQTRIPTSEGFEVTK